MRYAFLLASLLLSTLAVAEETVTIKLVVTVPATTPISDKVYVAGNAKALGEWAAGGVALARKDDGTYTADIKLAKGSEVEFKFTRGSWETVEKQADGSEVDNRKLTADSDRDEKIEIKAWRDTAATKPTASVDRPHTVAGDLRLHEHFHSAILANDRTIRVWLPAGYESASSRRYPTFYLHDGQNLFDAATSFAGEWEADETATRLIADQKIEPIILIGVDNAGAARLAEYAPTNDLRHGVGKANLYGRFLVEELKPFIDQTYRTLPDRDHTATGGSSMGGLVSLYLGTQFANTFGKIAVMSPSLWWGDEALLKSIERDPSPLLKERVWIDIGTAEAASSEETVDPARRLAAACKAAGLVENASYRYAEIEGAKHNEAAWRARFDRVLVHLFGV